MRARYLLLYVLWTSLVWGADVQPMVARGELAYREGRWVEARDTLIRAAGLTENKDLKQEILMRAGEMNMALLMSPYEQPGCIWLEVQPGDTLGKISRRAGTTIELLKAMNRMSSNNIRLGRRIKVLVEPFDVVIDKSENTATLYLGGQFFKRYDVSTGATANTPEGDFKITDRIVHPDWWHPVSKEKIPYGDPGHKIGTHWLGWDVKGFGIHGTDEPEKIGQAVSLGCVRMRNEDVEELFILLPSGTPVRVKE
ncbi:L,D-transpeptidase family protein [Kiritimatiellaeota bacterium B1221]|nr:L,D-transpeptidase family protein [Kiritimatiellaeota bacterium B1221]